MPTKAKTVLVWRNGEAVETFREAKKLVGLHETFQVFCFFKSGVEGFLLLCGFVLVSIFCFFRLKEV